MTKRVRSTTSHQRLARSEAHKTELRALCANITLIANDRLRPKTDIPVSYAEGARLTFATPNCATYQKTFGGSRARSRRDQFPGSSP